MKIGKGATAGLSICGIACIIMIILVLLSKQVSDFISWMFGLFIFLLKDRIIMIIILIIILALLQSFIIKPIRVVKKYT